MLPAHAASLAAMIEADLVVVTGCTVCRRWRELRRPDLERLAERVGPDYSLHNRRCRCRLKAGCMGHGR